MARRRKNGAGQQPQTEDEAPPADRKHNIAGIAADKLHSFIERIENLETDKAVIAADIKEVYAEAKGHGFDTKIIRILVKERRMDADDLAKQQDLIAIYKEALGIFVDTPLGAAAVASVSKWAAKTNGGAVQPHAIARETGYADGLAGVQDHAARWPAGEYGHADYALGWEEGRTARPT